MKRAIALRHKREKTEGVVVSLSETVRGAIEEGRGENGQVIKWAKKKYVYEADVK